MKKAKYIIVFLISITLLSGIPGCGSDVNKKGIIWEKQYSKGGYGAGNFVQQTSDGGFIVIGDGENKGWDTWLIKTDSTGKIIWDKTYGGDYADYGYCVQPTSDSGYIFCGSTMVGADWTEAYKLAEQLWLVKIDANGEVMWEKILGDEHYDTGRFVQQTSDGGYIVTGIKSSNGSLWILKFDSDGNKLWEKVNYSASGQCIQQTNDGFIILGSTWSTDTGSDIVLVKTDIIGDIMWTKIFGGKHEDTGSIVRCTTDGGYVLIGTTEDFDSRYSSYIYVIKTDQDGNLLWEKRLGEKDSSNSGNSIIETVDGDYVLTGSIDMAKRGSLDIKHAIAISKINRYGEILWQEQIIIEDYGQGSSIIQTKDGKYVIAGTSGRNQSLRDIFSLKGCDIDAKSNSHLVLLKYEDQH
jgi:hypothetical protein